MTEITHLLDAAAAGDRKAAADLLELDDALDRLAKEYPAVADLVKLRFFAGMTLGDAADALGIPGELLTGTGLMPGPGSPTRWRAGNPEDSFEFHGALPGRMGHWE